MDWRIEFEAAAIKELKKLGKPTRKLLLDYLESRIATGGNPRRFGKGLTGNNAGLWRYRVGDYRIICRMEDRQLVVLVVRVGH